MPLRHVLGLRTVDLPAKRVTVGFAALKLASCHGRVPTPDGFIELEWTREDGRLDYHLKTRPAGNRNHQRQGLTLRAP